MKFGQMSSQRDIVILLRQMFARYLRGICLISPAGHVAIRKHTKFFSKEDRVEFRVVVLINIAIGDSYLNQKSSLVQLTYIYKHRNRGQDLQPDI